MSFLPLSGLLQTYTCENRNIYLHCIICVLRNQWDYTIHVVLQFILHLEICPRSFYISPCSPASLFAGCRVFQRTVLYSDFWNSSLWMDISVYCCFSISYNGVATAHGGISPWQMSRGGVYAHFALGWILPNCSSKCLLQPPQPPRESSFPPPSPTLKFISFFKCSHSEVRNDFIAGLICISLIIKLTPVSELSNRWQIVYIERQVEAGGGKWHDLV